MRLWVLCGLGILGNAPVHANTVQQVNVDDPQQWRLQVSEGGQAGVQRQVTSQGDALCVVWDFGALPGSLRLVSERKLSLPARLRLLLQGQVAATAAAQVSVHLDDSRGRQWAAHRDARLGRDGQSWRLLDAQFTDAAGKSLADALPLQARALQLRVAAPQGGRGQWCVSSIQLATVPADPSPLTANALADTATALQHRMVDGKPDTLWVSTGVKQQTLSIDLGREREIGGLVVNWAPGMRASHYDVQSSLDGRRWQPLHQVREAAGNADRLRLGPLPVRYLRLDLKDGPNWRYGIVDLAAQPVEWGRTVEAWLGEAGKSLPPGSLPASLRGGPVQWRVLGAAGALAPAWFSDSGVVEPLPGTFTIEPWLQVDGQWQGPGQVQSQARSLDNGAAARWDAGHVALEVQARPGRDRDGRPWVQLEYRVSNTASAPTRTGLALLLRPFQLQPAGRRDDLVGGVGGLYRLQVEPERVLVNDRLALIPPEGAKDRFARHYDAGLDVALLRAGKWPAATSADDAQGLASGALLWDLELAAGEQRRYQAWIPLLAKGMTATDRPVGFQTTQSPDGLLLPGDAGQQMRHAWSAALERMKAEQAGHWFRVDSRLSLGAGNRDAMAIADALTVAGQFEPVKAWLMARIASGSTRRCDLLAHWAGVAGRIQASHGWKEEELAALGPWLMDSHARLSESGSCQGQVEAEAGARAASSLATLMPAAPPLADTAVIGNPSAVSDGPAVVVPADPALTTASPDTVPGAIRPIEVNDPTQPIDTTTAMPPVGPAASPGQRRQRWMAALEVLPTAHLPPGWQRCSASACEGLVDARQSAQWVTAIAQVLLAEEHDHLRLLPGLPADLWGQDLQVPSLATHWGLLGMSAQREGEDWVIRFAQGLQLPPAGLVIDWPWRDPPGTVVADGLPQSWERGRLRLSAVPHELRIALPSSMD